MGVFSGKKSPAEQRRKLLADIVAAAKANNTTGLTYGVLSLREDGHMDAPEMPFALNGAVETLAQHDVAGALGIAIWMIQTVGNPAVREMLSEKTFNLMERVDTSRLNNVATIAAAANVIVSHAPQGSATEKRGMAAWTSAMEKLAARREGLDFAFAAASNAALGTGHAALRDLGRATWKKIVEDVAKTDLGAARKEAERVKWGYESFGMEAMPFRLQADETLEKLARQPKPKTP